MAPGYSNGPPASSPGEGATGVAGAFYAEEELKIRVQDAHRSEFAWQRRSRLRRVAAGDRSDMEPAHFLEEALADVDGCSPRILL